MRPIALSGYKELGRHFQEDPRGALVNLTENLQDGTFKPSDFSLRLLFEHTVEDGRYILDAVDTRRKSGRADLLENAGTVSVTDFANITGQIVFSQILEGYNSPTLLWPMLVESRSTPFPYGERAAGIGEVGDKEDVVGEGEAYPVAGPNEEYVDYQPPVKKGLIVPVTREAIVFDNTGLVLTRAKNLGFSHGLQLEKRVLDVVTGQVNTYSRNGVATNTYLTSGAYINSASNTFTDWTSVQTAELLFDAITDPNTGEPVVLEAADLLVPSALKRSANRVLMASEVAQVDNQANASTVRTMSPNPMDRGFYGQPKYGVLSNAYVKSRTSSASTWFFGDFKKAFGRRYNWEMEITEAPQNNIDMFRRDIWVQTKVSSRDAIDVKNPRYVVKCT